MSDPKFYCHAEDLAIGYGKTPLMEHIGLGVGKGTILTLIGPNGAGKSTLLKTLAAQLAPQGGAVLLDGKNLADYSGPERARKMALMVPHTRRTELTTCFEMASAGRYPYTGRLGVLSAEDKRQVHAALALVGAEALAGRDFNRISDGQRQRVLLARAICQQPELILLDEPTSFLDIKGKAELLTILKSLARDKKMAVILSLHELELAQKISDKVVCVSAAGVSDVMTPEKAFARENICKIYALTDEQYAFLYGEEKAPEGKRPLFEHYVRSGQKLLRCGYTTGTCAALGAAGAARLLLTGRNLGTTNVVEQRGLAVVNVAHDRDDRRTRQSGIFDVLQFTEDGFGIVRLGGDGLVAHFLDDEHRRVLIEHLVDRDHLPHLHEGLDHFGGLDGHLVGKVRNADRLRHLNFTHHLLLNLLNGFGMTVAVLAATAAGRAPAGLPGIVLTARLDRAAMLTLITEAVGAALAALLAVGRVALAAITGILLRLGGRTLRTSGLLGLVILGGRLLLSGLRGFGGLFSGLDLLGGENSVLAVHHGADAAGLLLGLAASFLAATAFGGLGLHALGSGGGHFSIKLGLFGLATGGLEGGLVLFLFLLQSFLTSTGFFSFTACGFGTFLGGAALLFLADAGFLGAAGLFSTGALLSLRTGAGFGSGLFLGGAAGLSGFGFSASSLLGEHLRILHEDALASHFDRNRTGAAGAVLLLDDALFLARDGDLALSRLRALDAQAVEQARLVGLAQFIRFARLVDARGSKLSQKRLGGHLEFLCEFAYRFAGHKFLSP